MHRANNTNAIFDYAVADRPSPIHLNRSRNEPHVLVVEDDAEISAMLTEFLAENGLKVSAASSAAEMHSVIQRARVDLLILDVVLPGENGVSICRRVRAGSNIPIIMVTALADHVDRIVGLEVGADDYVTKPFDSRELLARIRAVLRRTAQAPQSGARPTRFAFAGFVIDAAAREFRAPDGSRTTLTSAEFDVLLAFCQNSGRVLSREELLSMTHGGAAGPVERTIDVHVSRLRCKIEPAPHSPTLIKTVRLGGYIFTPRVIAV
jgi:two-component system OmpR family response regulator